MKQAFAPLSMKNVVLTGGLLGEKQRVNAEVTVPHIYAKLEETGRIDSLRCAWKEGQPNRPHPFWDSDIGKMIEAASYTLITQPDKNLEANIDAIVDLLAEEQLPDGYLNSYFKTCELENRWTNLYYMHELYCAGHLIEGAVAYAEATGKRKFLDLMCRYADHIGSKFGPEEGKIRGYCGHPEIELALVRLYKATKNESYLELSKYFIDERGRQPYFFERESLARGVDTTKTANQTRHLKYFLKSRGPFAEYQAHTPTREQREPVGHAVRAMYLYSGMADIAAAYGDEALLEACKAIWKSLATSQFYITGGVGQASDGERFTFAYDLPNEITYNESCASAALVMWAQRMLQIEGEGKYADILEQTLYNTVLGSVSREGNRFFYANYLSVYPERFTHSSAAVIDKMKAERQEWFDVACCPPNVSRLIGSLGNYVFSQGEESLYIHLYADSTASFSVGGGSARLKVSTDYPWEGQVRIALDFEKETAFTLGLRIPGWCLNWSVKLNGREVEHRLEKGYCLIEGNFWLDLVELELAMPVLRMEANPKVREDCGRTALQRGPVVYCIEEADNGKGINDIAIADDTEIRQSKGIAGVSPEAVTLEFSGYRRIAADWDEKLYSPNPSPLRRVNVKAVPYFLWGNRGFGEMLVWILKRGK
ncbi:MAG: glycoside hydrolase family 127 protein [Spirochaetales bacterium]